MAACAFSTLYVGRHATARSRSLMATQWSTSSSRPAGGASAFRSSSSPIHNGSSSTVTLPRATLCSTSSAATSGAYEDGARSSSWDWSEVSSLMAFAASTSLALSVMSEPSTRTSPLYRSTTTSCEGAQQKPSPMATSSAFASPLSAASLGVDSLTSNTHNNNDKASGDHHSNNNGSGTSAVRKVRIRRTVQRRYPIEEALEGLQRSILPDKFRFSKESLASCEAMPKEKNPANDFLSSTKPYEVRTLR